MHCNTHCLSAWILTCVNQDVLHYPINYHFLRKARSCGHSEGMVKSLAGGVEAVNVVKVK